MVPAFPARSHADALAASEAAACAILVSTWRALAREMMRSAVGTPRLVPPTQRVAGVAASARKSAQLQYSCRCVAQRHVSLRASSRATRLSISAQQTASQGGNNDASSAALDEVKLLTCAHRGKLRARCMRLPLTRMLARARNIQITSGSPKTLRSRRACMALALLSPPSSPTFSACKRRGNVIVCKYAPVRDAVD